MRRESALTFNGALRILGRTSTPGVDKVDKLLGGIILAAGVGVGLASTADEALGPVALLAPLWGWVDQKNEGIGLLRAVVSALSPTIAGVAGLERRELVAAAHTTIAAAAFLEVLDERLGRRALSQLRLTDEDRVALTLGSRRHLRDSMIDRLYLADVPAPSASVGFAENVGDIQAWMEALATSTENFLLGFAAWSVVGVGLDSVAPAATRRYESHYVALAATVPEFRVWAALGEHAATRGAVLEATTSISAILASQHTSFERIETLLAALQVNAGRPAGVSQAVFRANRGRLHESVISAPGERYETAITFPTVGELFVRPSYRIARFGAATRPADEKWWSRVPAKNDLDIMLLAHLLSADAIRMPLLLLGHPGAGKSMITKVLAAHLPPESYTVVRVPLRAVGADESVLDQVQHGLDISTNRRAGWAELAHENASVLRVVLLDGLDELLQASNTDRSSYLQEIVRFQQVEAEQGCPVAVLVTSRTVVTDRVDIPVGSTIVKLEPFGDAQITAWLAVWKEANAAAIQAGKIRELTVAEAQRQRHLSCQPLLLLMLAVYATDSARPELDENLSTTALYDRLFDGFGRREAAKSAGRLSELETDAAVRASTNRLCIAALAMFNRGRQSVAEAELGNDIAALTAQSTPGLPAQAGQRLLAEFFFVHASEATIIGGGLPAESTTRRIERTYEFLHATFAEYLVARKIIEELRDIADAAYGGRRGRREPDDQFLFALLSHQALVVRRPMVTFAAEMCHALPPDEQAQLVEVLEYFISAFRRRTASGRYSAYQPSQDDHVRRLAMFSANLVLLRVAFEPGGSPVPLADLFPVSMSRGWVSVVTLWRSGMDADSWLATLGCLRVEAGSHLLLSTGDMPTPTLGAADYDYATLIGDAPAAARFQLGAALLSDSDAHRKGAWHAAMMSWMLLALAGASAQWNVLPPPHGTMNQAINDVAYTAARLLRADTAMAPAEDVAALAGFVARFPPFPRDPYAMAMAVCRRPVLLALAPELRNPDHYRGAHGMPIMMAANAYLVQQPEQQAWQALYKSLLVHPGQDPESDPERLVEMLLAPVRARRPGSL